MKGFGDLSIVSFLKTKMKWHQARQKVLAENVANADTPRYRPNDLKPLTFQEALNPPASTGVSLMRTNKAHIAASTGEPSPFRSRQGRDFEVTPEGNAVVLEDQMMKVSENAFDYQMASSIYTRSLGLIRTALGRNG